MRACVRACVRACMCVCVCVCVGRLVFCSKFQIMLAAMGPPGGGRNHITGRITRHFNVIGIESFDDSTMTKIFTSIADWHFGHGFEAAFNRLGKVSCHSLLGTKRSSLFAYRVTLILNDRVIIKGVQDVMKKKIPDGPTERERHV